MVGVHNTRTRSTAVAETNRCLLFNRSDNVPLSRLFSFENDSRTVSNILETVFGCFDVLMHAFLVSVHARLAVVPGDDVCFRLVATPRGAPDDFVVSS